MNTLFSYIVFFLLLLGCSPKSEKTETLNNQENSLLPIQEKTTSVAISEKPLKSNKNKATVNFQYDNNLLLSRSGFETSIFIYEGALVIQLMKEKDEVLISFGGPKLYEKKPYTGNFTLSPQENENTVLVNLDVKNENNDKIKTPMFFDGTATITHFTNEEIKIEINAKGGFYNEIDIPEVWKPITAKISVQNPQFSEINATTQKLLY